MKLAFKLLIVALLLSANTYLYINAKAEDRLSFDEIVQATTADSIIKNSYKPADQPYEEVEYYNGDAEFVEEKVKIDYPYDKHLDKHSDDYLGAIEIPSIGVSDSIYASTGEFYLDRNYKKESYELGEIYLDDRSSDSLTGDGALLNGHAVKNGKKFGNFKKLLDLEEQPEIFIWDEKLQTTVKYRVLFVSLIDGDNSGIIMKFPNNEMRVQYYNNLYSSSIKRWEQPTEGEYLLLNSCSYIIKDGRYVVIAKKED